MKETESNDLYKTLSGATEEAVYKEKGSRFIGAAFPVSREEEITEIIQKLKKEHHKARHCCYAYRIGAGQEQYRVNDDGEPSHSAGMPIYGQILSFGLTNVLVTVVRYFGGVKLGVGGLMNAYKTAAQLTLEKAEIITKSIDQEVEITFAYEHMNMVMKVIREYNQEIKEQVMELHCRMVLSVRKNRFEKMYQALKSLRIGEVKKSEQLPDFL